MYWSFTGRDFLLVLCVGSSSKEFVVTGMKGKGFASSNEGRITARVWILCCVCTGGTADPVFKVYPQPFLGFSWVLSKTWSWILKIKHEAVLSVPPFYCGRCEDGPSRQNVALLCDLEVETGCQIEWEKSLEVVLGSRLTFLKWLSTVAGHMSWVHSADKCRVFSHPTVYVSFCPVHSCSVLNWSLVMRTVCATHTHTQVGQCSKREWQYCYDITTE